jgi:hypothetical protein
MSGYVPELMNELTRIVLTTRNENESVEEYEAVVLPEWKKCESVRAKWAAAGGRPPSLEELRQVYESVLLMLRVKQVPPDEVRARIDEAFERCREGAYPVDRRAIEEHRGSTPEGRMLELRS